MNNKKDVFEIIDEFPQKQDIDSCVPIDVKELAKELYGEHGKAKRQRRKIYYKAFVSALSVCIVFLAVFLPTFFHFNKTGEPIYYSADMMYSEKVTDIGEYMLSNNISANYFIGNMGGDSNTANYLIESRKFVFIFQQILFVGQDGYDLVELGIVPSEDKFDKFDGFILLDKKYEIDKVRIEYKEIIEQDKTVIFAKFKVNDVNYYLKVAANQPEGKLEGYVKQLLKNP